MIDLTGVLAAARWFGGKGRPFRVSRVERLGVLPPPSPAEDGGWPDVVVDLAVVEYDDAEGGEELYQLPLARYPLAQEDLSHALVGVEKDGHQTLFTYDAVHDHAAMARMLGAFATDPSGPLGFRRLPGHELDLSARSTLMTGEQSNSSVAFGEDSLLKIFRKVTPGTNPDIEIHAALTRAGCEHIAALYGWVEAPWHGGTLSLGMLQQFLRTASDGFELAQASVRNLFAEADLHAGEVGGDFGAESARLGEAVAAVHAVLRAELPGGEVDLGGVAAAMTDRLAAAVEVLPDLATFAPILRERFRRLSALGVRPTQRIHGDLHLGQTLRTVKGWKIVDFEGEPAKTLHERQLPDLVWRDVAGMVRSYDYAARIVERTMGTDNPASREQLDFRAAEWADHNAAAFVAAYAGRGLTQEEELILAAYLADKAVYEAVYESRNRPAWVAIPLEAIARLCR